MKTYIGKRDGETTVDPTLVMVNDITIQGKGGTFYPLKHHVRHSPSGFNWGYNGSGPAELSRCILIDYLGTERVSSALYQEFKARYIAGLAQDRGWEISEAALISFLRGPAAQSIERWLDEEDAPPDIGGVIALDEWYEAQDRVNKELKARYGTVRS